jgi:hypothetical protein
MKAINDIQKIRAKNNKLWMDLLRLALKAAPKEAKAVLKEINKNDKAISKALKSLV